MTENRKGENKGTVPHRLVTSVSSSIFVPGCKTLCEIKPQSLKSRPSERSHIVKKTEDERS